MPQDHYLTLGISRDATPDEIKRAYRKLAREHHPDANSQDPGSEERFKVVSLAYEVLSDPEKRQRYDTYGEERGPQGFGDFGDISDLFASFFGGAGGGRGRRGPARGSDILAEVQLTLEEAAAGAERDVEVEMLSQCPDCEGVGAAPGSFPSRCGECRGTGELRQVRRTVFGNVVTAAPCARCAGTGQVILDPCLRCKGVGRIPLQDTLTVQIPPGVDDGARLRVTGRGEAGPRGGQSGDLYVSIGVAPHDVFQRAGDDLACEVKIPMTIAALGGVAQVPTLDGHEEIEISPGTQSGEVIRFRGKGMPRLNGRGRGELVGVLRVETPLDLSGEEAELLEQFAKLRGDGAHPRAGFFDRIKEAFN